MATDSLNIYLRKKKLLCSSMNVPKHYYEYWEGKQEDGSLPCKKARREEPEVDEQYDGNMDLVMSNYVLMKTIFSYLPSWQDLKISSAVSPFWADMVSSITRNCFKSQAFCLYFSDGVILEKEFLKAEPEPLLILAFANAKSLQFAFPCESFPDSPCTRNCKAQHKMMDYIFASMCYPSQSLLGISCPRVLYYPPSTKDNKERCTFNNSIARKRPFLCGVSLPKIPGVNVHTVSSRKSSDTEHVLIQKISAILPKEVIKGILIFVGSQYPFLEDNLHAAIRVIKDSQGKDFSLAIGGCAINCSFKKDFNMSSLRDGHALSIVIFSVPKDIQHEVEFDLYSGVFLEGRDIEAKMEQLSDIPRREGSAAIKLSCVGRTDLDQQEHEVFSKYFPSTSLVGCYGQQEIGVDCYPSFQPPKTSKPPVRPRSKFWPVDIFHAYSTVLVVFMWGKHLTVQSPSD